MDLKEFAMVMAFSVQKKMPAGVEVLPQTVGKNNGVVWQGLTFRKTGCQSAPTIYMEPYYEAYKDGMTMEMLTEQVTDCYRGYAGHPQFEPDFFQSYEEIRGRIVYKLIHYGSNEQLLQEVPHLPYLDLAVVFYCMISHSEIGMATVLIRDSHMKMWNVTHSTLYEDARKNTPRLLESEFKSMSQVFQLALEEIKDAPMLYVLTNREHMNGAASLLYEGELDKCAERLKGSFFLLPSSIHEVLLLPYNRNVDIGRLRSIVREANDTQVQPQDKLSDSVYFYSREEKKLILL